MAPLIATLICAMGIAILFRLNRERGVQPSAALWIPTMWLFIAASRNFSDWLQISPGGSTDYTEGSPLDRAVLTGILALGVVALIMRRGRVAQLLRSQVPILVYFLYCGVSVAWSDFPDVAGKRWFRACGDLVMVLIVLSEPDWLVSFRRLFSRLGFLLVPLSILFIRYYPDLGRRYSRGGRFFWVGVATDKNALGMICLLFGLAALYRFVQLYREPKSNTRKHQLIAQGTLLVMTAYLIHEADSATALSCFVLAGTLMLLTFFFSWARKPVVLHFMVFLSVGVALSALFLGFGSGLVEDLGRNSTLTGRTAIWHSAISKMHNPLLGAGFESFWIGPRLVQVEEDIHQGVNQAHNGYLEIYLNLGWIGIVILASLLVVGYRRIIPAVRRETQAGSLRLAYFVVALAYNFTEGGFKMMHPVWITLLLIISIVPKSRPLSPSKSAARPLEAAAPAEAMAGDPEVAMPGLTTGGRIF
jgi:exopolysaccharide production protein ExoQ